MSAAEPKAYLPTDEELERRADELSSGSATFRPFVLAQLRRHRESLRAILGQCDARTLALHIVDLFDVLLGERPDDRGEGAHEG